MTHICIMRHRGYTCTQMGFVEFIMVFVINHYWINMMYLPISFRVASLALGQSYDCPSASEATLKDMDEIDHQVPQQNTRDLEPCANVLWWTLFINIYHEAGNFTSMYIYTHTSTRSTFTPQGSVPSSKTAWKTNSTWHESDAMNEVVYTQDVILYRIYYVLHRYAANMPILYRVQKSIPRVSRLTLPVQAPIIPKMLSQQ